MARFRAYTSDSSSTSSDEDEAEPVEATSSAKGHPRGNTNVEADRDPESDVGEESSGSKSSSEMHEDELLSSPPRRRQKSKNQDRNALVEDENGDIRFAHEVHVHVSPPSSSSRSSPPANPRATGRGDPTIIPWAKHVGVDAQKMHVMQTSLFRMPEEAAALKALNEPQRAQRLDVNAKSQTVNRKHSRDSDGDGLRFDSRERASFAHDVDPPIFRPSRKYARVAATSSIANGHEGAYFDAGLSMGRSFRVGWGPGGQLVHLGSICSPMSTSKTSSNSSTLTLTKTIPSLAPPTDTPSSSNPSSLAAKLLQHHLSHTTISRDEADVPCAYPTTSSSSLPTSSQRTWTQAPATSPDPLNFASFALLFPSGEASNPAPLFRLGSALFDPIELHLGRSKTQTIVDSGTAITPDIRNRVSLLRRKRALSKWLEVVVKPAVDGDLRTEVNGSNVTYSPADAAFTHLTGHQVSEACKAAEDGGYMKLSTLISQAGGDDIYKDDIVAQLEIWKSEKLAPGSNSSLGSSKNGLVGRGVWRVYNLLGGLLLGGAVEGRLPEDHICVGLDWKRVFGLCLWYGESVDASVADVVDAYERILFQNSRTNTYKIARPTPKWISNAAPGTSGPHAPPLGSSRLGLFSLSDPLGDQVPDDPLYALIRLHANPALSLSNALNPLSFAPSGMAWGIGMCWHLYVILSRVMRIRDFADRGDPGVRTSTTPKKDRPKPHGINGFGMSTSSDRGNTTGSDASREDDDDDIQPEGHSPTADLLASSYAFELESWGMVQEAVFVLLHLEGSVGREKAVKDLLARSGSKLDDWMTRGLVGSLKLPMIWIDEAKAMHALDKGDLFSAYELYLSAQVYQSAHNLALHELAPDAIIRKDLDLLRSLFIRFDGDGKRDKIENWFVRGKVFLDYVEVMTSLPRLLDQVASEREEGETMLDATQAAEITELSGRIPRIIGLLPDILHRSRARDDRHPAALEEMTKDLLKLAERADPLLLSQIQGPTLGMLDGATKINLVRGLGYARFLQSIEA
ncbi:nuclear protein 96-domain-containing protein [Crassisporium funariophilum]|nr:nuclear protein 96-domain-containing protein [Crassisporium funariophilum]